MSTIMEAMTQAAVTYGKANPKDRQQIDHFWRKTVLTLSPKKRQAIFDEVFSMSTGLDATLANQAHAHQDVNAMLKLARASAGRKSRRRATANM